ncbi:hypothetical protein [Lysinibacillus xylanilyticus]
MSFFKYMRCILVDWRGDWVTPWGLAAHRTPPGKRPVGTEINHTLWQ